VFSDKRGIEVMDAQTKMIAAALADATIVRQPTLIEFLPGEDGQLEGHVKQATSYTVTPDE
jgi:hypothetical protein